MMHIVLSGKEFKKQYGKTPLMYACYLLKENNVTELLRLGANMNMIDEYGETALHQIAHKKNDLEKKERIMKMLIKAGCNLRIRDSNSKTFIDILKRHNHQKTVKKLEEWIKETRME